MSIPTITCKEYGRLILERITNAPKKPGRPSYVKIANPQKKRGRPRKKKNKFFTEDCSLRNLKLLSFKISRELHVRCSSVTCQLAEAAITYKVMTKVKEEGPLAVKGKTNRSNINYSILLWDIAHIIQGTGHGRATELLGKINGYNEGRAKEKGEPSTAIVDKYARAIFAALGERYVSSLRRQAINARKIQKIKMI